jgi:hypothetical protein
MTEAEAATKWCPFSRVGSGGSKGSGWNRPEHESFGHREKIGGENHCIGSACMVWRSTGDVPGAVLERRDMGVAAPPDGWQRSNTAHPDTINKSFGDWIRLGPWMPTGYCGLAGAPQ